MIIHQRDVKAAFLNGELKNEIYMAKPDGFIKEENPDLVWKLKKAIYGLIKAYDQLCQLDREFAGNDKWDTVCKRAETYGKMRHVGKRFTRASFYAWGLFGACLGFT